MRRYFSFLLRYQWAALTLTALVAVTGVVAWRSLPIDAFPDATNIQVMVFAKSEGLSAQDMEQRVTYPIEQEMNGLPRVDLVRSLSLPGLTQVVVVFEDDVDPYFARQVVFERLQGARESLPPGVEPELGPMSTGLGEIFQYTVEGEGISLMERRAIQDWLIAPRLRTVPGVTEVNSQGGHVRQYQVNVHPDKLLAYGLTLREVEEALGRNNANAGGGYILKGWEQMFIRGVGLYRSAEDIGRVVLKTERGTPVLVRDVADIAIGPMPRQGAATRDGKGETVAGMVIQLRGENSRTVVERVKAAVADLADSLPKGLHIDVFYDRTELVQACISTVEDALFQGAILVIIVLFLFLAELRTAVVVVLSLPITFLCTFIVMASTGMSSNLMSLGGIAFSVGMVVDASIVVAENIRRHFATNGDRSQRASIVVESMVEVARPVAFSVLIIAIVLVPLLTLQGIEGKMFRPLALTLLYALLTSIVVAVAVVPPLANRLLKQIPEHEFGFVRRFHQSYRRLLRGALGHPRVTFGISVVFLLLSLALVPLLGTEFIPDLDEGSIAINVVRLPTASLEGSVVTAGMIERRLLRFPEVQTVVAKTGRAEVSEDPMGPEQSDFFVMLKPKREWKTGRSKQQLVEAMAAELAAIPGIRPAFSQPIALRVNELISGVKSDLAVKIFGSDLETLRKAAERAAFVLGEVEGARDVKIEQVAGMVGVEIVPDRAAMARWGLNAGDLNDLIEGGIAGRPVTQFVEGERRFDVVTRLDEAARRDPDALATLLVPAPGGGHVPLGQVARIVTRDGPAQISREHGMRRIVVEANVRGRDLGGFVGEVRKRLHALATELPRGYWIEYGGQFENQQRAMRQLAIVVPIALLLILFLLYSALGTMRNSLLVIVNLPFALVGGVIAAVAFGMHLSVSAAVAFIVLLGIAVQNGVVLVAFFNQLRAQGLTISEAVERGCELRFRPLFMTALVSFIGHLPMVYSTGAGADIQKPLAVVVMGGIVTCTLLTLLVLPVLYAAVERRATARNTSAA